MECRVASLRQLSFFFKLRTDVIVNFLLIFIHKNRDLYVKIAYMFIY